MSLVLTFFIIISFSLLTSNLFSTFPELTSSEYQILFSKSFFIFNFGQTLMCFYNLLLSIEWVGSIGQGIKSS